MSLVFLVKFQETRTAKEDPDQQKFFLDACAKFGVKESDGWRLSDVVTQSTYEPGSYNDPKRCDDCGHEAPYKHIIRLHKYLMKHGEWVILNFISYILLLHNVHYSETK
jgi:hypothetical protein